MARNYNIINMNNNDYVIYSIEDDPDIGNIICLALRGQGFTVESFATGEDFLCRFEERKPNMVLLDMMLPGIQGRDILRKIREDQNNRDVIVIIVSAKSLVSDKIDALNLGGDDYISKPFDINEFISRINAHYRRHIQSKADSGDVLHLGIYTIDFANRTVKVNDKLVELTKSEYEVCEILFRNHGKTVYKQEISDALYGETSDSEKLRKQFRVIDMYVKSLRQKLQDYDKEFIRTVFGTGYLIHE